MFVKNHSENSLNLPVNGQMRHSDGVILMIEVFLKLSVSRHLSEIIHSS